MEEEFTSGAELENEVQLLYRLEGKLQVNDKRVVDVLEDKSLGKGVLHLVLLNQVFFLKHFDCVNLLSRLHSAKYDLAIRAGTDHFDKLEIVNAHADGIVLRLAINVIGVRFHIY